jgi:hypothetical protein
MKNFNPTGEWLITLIQNINHNQNISINNHHLHKYNHHNLSHNNNQNNLITILY